MLQRLTAHAFACGYVEVNEPVRIFREHGVYHVRVRPADWRPHLEARGVSRWQSFRTLAAARKHAAKVRRILREG